MPRYDTVTVDGSPMRVYLASPEGSGPFPAVVIAHHRDALDDFCCAAADRLARNGYVAMVPHLFHRRPKDEPTTESVKTLDDAEITADIAAAMAHLKSMPNVARDRIAIMGHCMGGRVAFMGAADVPGFAACAIFYGGSIMEPKGRAKEAPFARAANIKMPVIGFFGNDDTNPSPADVGKLDAELTRLGIAHEFHRYDGTGHAFQNFLNKDNYRAVSSEDAWSKLIPFLGRTIGHSRTAA